MLLKIKIKNIKKKKTYLLLNRGVGHFAKLHFARLHFANFFENMWRIKKMWHFAKLQFAKLHFAKLKIIK